MDPEAGAGGRLSGNVLLVMAAQEVRILLEELSRSDTEDLDGEESQRFWIRSS